MTAFTMTIAGNAVRGNHHFEVINPATEEAFALAPEVSTTEINQAVQSAHDAFQTWRHTSVATRRAVIEKMIVALEKEAGALVVLLSQEQGKPLKKAHEELVWALSDLRDIAALEIPVDVLQDDDQLRVEVQRVPLGVIAAIAPWNFPIGTATYKVGAALLCGNTVVLKSSPMTPLTMLRIGEIWREILPAGVMNVLSGNNEAGAKLTEHPLIAAISFTGSVATGKKIADVAARDLKRVTLELGGNDPAIVLANANPKKIAKDIFWGAFGNTGQVCEAIKRLYVHEKVYDAMLVELTQLAKSAVVGDGLDPKTEMGPLNNKMQLNRVKELVADAIMHGAKIVTGGEQLNQPGYFYPPTLVTHIKEGVRLVDEEQFGPVLPLIKFDSTEDVIARANNTKMGLGASVWSEDLVEATKVANQLEAGIVRVNTLAGHGAAPFGGMKHSGLGREGGEWTVHAMMEPRSVTIRKK